MTFERDFVVHGEDPQGTVFRVTAMSTRRRFDVDGYATEAILSVVGHGVLRDGVPACQYRLATEEEKAAAREQGTLPDEAV